MVSRPSPAVVPEPPAPAPEWLGFDEPVGHEENFADASGEAEVVPMPEPVEPAALEVAAAVRESELEREYLPEPPPALEPIRARVRDLPPGPAISTAAEPPRPRNLVGRLGRLPDEPAPVAPRFVPLPPEKPPLAQPAAPAPPPASPSPEPVTPPFDPLSPPPPPTPVVRPVEPEQKLVTPAPAPPSADRSGRPSLPRNRRMYRRAKIPAEIEIDSVPCTLIDVSIGGFAATGVQQLEPNAMVPVTIRLTIDGIEVGTQFNARIIYVTQGRSSGRFVDLSPSQMAFLRYVVTWRGESVGAVGTTTLLDAIAGGAERGFAPGSGGRGDDAPKSRWWAGLIGRKIDPAR